MWLAEPFVDIATVKGSKFMGTLTTSDAVKVIGPEVKSHIKGLDFCS